MSAEYYQPVDEQAFMQACPDSLDKVLNKYSKLVRAGPANSPWRSRSSGDGGQVGGRPARGGINLRRLSAAKADIRIGDVILEIDGVSTQGMALRQRCINACVGLLVLR